MPQALEIPSLNGGGQSRTWTDADIDSIINRMVTQESGGNPNAVGKKGEIGLLQIMPNTARQYGVANPELLKNPAINRWVAKRYLSDLLTQFHGNMNLALEAYNAGPGRVGKAQKGVGSIPGTSVRYAQEAMGGLGGQESGGAVPQTGSQGLLQRFGIEGTANAAELPPPPKGYRIDPEDPSRAIPATDPPPGYRIDPVDPTRAIPIAPAVPSATPPAKPEPFLARAAGWLPTVGQTAGEFAGATGGAAIPFAGESGIPEYAGAVGGGAAGSAIGAEAENAIRRRMGLPPVSVGSEAAWGAGGSAVGGLLPFIPRLRKAAAISRATGKSFSQAWEEAGTVLADLEKTVGVSPRKAVLLQSSPSTPVQRAYESTLNQQLAGIGKEYDNLLRAHYHKRTANSVARVLARVDKTLELAGKPLRQSIDEEIHKSPMTVRRAQVILSNLRQMERGLNPDQSRVARGAIQELEKAVGNDIDQIIGVGGAVQRRVLDQAYARTIARFPIKPMRQADKLPAAAEAIRKSKAGDVGRVVDVIHDMERAGKVQVLRNATAARLFQSAGEKGFEGGRSVTDLKALRKAVEDIKPEVFDALYGKGSRALWLRTSQDLIDRQGELLKHPNEAAAIAADVGKYLKEPGALARFVPFAQHHMLYGALLALGGHEYGKATLVTLGGVLLGSGMYNAVAHSRMGVSLLGAAARTRNTQAAARLIIAAMNAAIREKAESTLAPQRTGTGG